MFEFISKENPNASFVAKAPLALAICKGRKILISGLGSARLIDACESLGFEKTGMSEFEIPILSKKCTEREKIVQPHFVSLCRIIQSKLHSHERLGFGFGFELVRQWEPSLGDIISTQIDGFLFLFDQWEPLIASLDLVKSDPLDPVDDSTSGHLNETSRENFVGQFYEAKKDFSQGELMELVVARTFRGVAPKSPRKWFEMYRTLCPSPYEYFIQIEDFIIAGCSPETQIRVNREREVLLRPISGTVRSEAEIPYLMSSPKEKAELDMLIDLGRNDVSRVCKPFVRVEDYRKLLHLSNVIHTYASVKGVLRDEYSAFDAVTSSMNAGTLTGAPKLAAMKKIAKLEGERRGFYGGCVGVALPDGALDSAIVIRTAMIDSNEMVFKTGATLLHSSVAENEFEETENKARALKQSYLAYRERFENE